jgi:hypothetical protein
MKSSYILKTIFSFIIPTIFALLAIIYGNNLWFSVKIIILIFFIVDRLSSTCKSLELRSSETDVLICGRLKINYAMVCSGEEKLVNLSLIKKIIALYDGLVGDADFVII